MGVLTIVDRPAPSDSYYVPERPRPVAGICIHHTGTLITARPGYGGSYHWQVSREPAAHGLTVVYRHMPESYVAHGAGNTNRWWPPWVPHGKAPGWSGSRINYVAIHVEIVYAPQEPHSQIPTPAQCTTTEQLLREICERWGPLPVVGHGEVDSTKWMTEPHWLNGEREGDPTSPKHWDALGLTRHEEGGHWLGPEAGRRWRRGHVPPPPGEPQPLQPVAAARAARKGRTPSDGSSQAGGGAGFATVNNRLFAPLQGLDPADVLQGGYGWLDKTDGGRTYHPGLDLNSGASCNADEGASVVAPLAGVVRQVLYWNGTTPGEGTHVWVELQDPCAPGPTWLHVDHLLAAHCVVGQRLAAGQQIGLCGRSGGWSCAHLHTELLRGPPQQGYWQWPYGWTRQQVEAAYYPPSDWWAAATALVLAEGGGTIPPEDYMILTGAQQAAVQAALWGEHWNPGAADFAIPTAWREEWKAGRYRGRPLGGEQPIPASEGKPAGAFMAFELGCCVWLPGEVPSWNG